MLGRGYGVKVENTDYYDISGSQPAVLNVAYCSLIEGNQSVRLAYRSTQELRVHYSLPIGFGAILALIKISCEGLEAINIVCRLNPKVMADMTLRVYSQDEPFELMSHGTENQELSEFQMVGF